MLLGTMKQYLETALRKKGEGVPRTTVFSPAGKKQVLLLLPLPLLDFFPLHFRAYLRGDFPLALSHTARGCKLSWKVRIYILLVRYMPAKGARRTIEGKENKGPTAKKTMRGKGDRVVVPTCYKAVY